MKHFGTYLIGLLSALVLGFLLGSLAMVAAQGFEVWPHQALQETVSLFQRYKKFGSLSPDGILQVATNSHRSRPVIIPQPNKLYPGYLVLLEWNEQADEFQANLIEKSPEIEQKKVLHTWRFPKYYENPHGFVVLPDASLLIISGRLGHQGSRGFLARFDSCSEAIWEHEGAFHHEIHPSYDGTYWAWKGKRFWSDQYQYLIQFNDQGEILREIGLVEESIIPYQAHRTFALPSRMRFLNPQEHDDAFDVFHPNDLDIVPPWFSEKVPGFQTGDILINLRNLNLLALLDGKTLEPKWSMRGPWERQHSPMFAKDGRILLFSNNPYYGASSSIVAVKPGSRETVELFPDGNLEFSTWSHGTFEPLPNGNMLITSSREGRVLEVDPKGDVVFEYTNIAKKGVVAHVPNARALPYDFFSSLPSCPAS